jgi:precorrin-6B methylase 2
MPSPEEGGWTDTDRAMQRLPPTEDSTFENIEVHRGMLSDSLAVECFRASLRELVETSHTVVDLGAGLGVLAFFSLAAGARMVYAIERNRTLELARQLAKENHVEDRVVFISADSTQVHLPRTANLVVSQTLGHLGFEEDILRWMIDARERMLAPGGRLIPCAVELYAVPAASRHAQDALSFWMSRPYDLDVSTIAKRAVSNIFVVDILPEEILATPKPAYTADLYRVTEPSFSSKTTYVINRDGIIQGLAGWFRAKLTDSIAIDTSPYSPRTHWRQCYLPLEHPIGVSNGDTVHVEVEMLSIDEANPVWSWSVYADNSYPDAGTARRQSTSRHL